MTLAELRRAISDAWLADEDTVVDALIPKARLSPAERAGTEALATELVTRIRASRETRSGVDAFTQEYALSSEEGVVLMCLAEALLRVPDAATADKLIRDKIGSGDWSKHLNKSDSALRQRVHLRADADGPRGQARRRGEVGFRGHLEEARHALERARHPPGRDDGDAHSRQAIRPRTHDRGSAEGIPRGDGGRLSLLLRHAGRGGLHAERRGSLLRVLQPCADGHCRGAAGPVHAGLRAAEHFGEIVGAASALRMGEARARLQ